MTGHSEGTLHLVVGPSGVGKDTLIDAARAARPDILFAQRAITRPMDAGGEEHEALSDAAFDARARAGGFALSWAAHGLRYGIPIAIIDALASGRHVVVNGSRGVVSEARARFPQTRVLLITASPDVLANRLAGRGREGAAAVAARLTRSSYGVPGDGNTIKIRNEGSIADATEAFLTALCAPNR